MTDNTWTVEALVERMKVEIERDFDEGVLFNDTRTFSQLHDSVDANKYGGLCEPDCPLKADSDADMAIINAATAIVDTWLMKRFLDNYDPPDPDGEEMFRDYAAESRDEAEKARKLK